MRTDYHLHTYFSDDSDYPMEKAVLKALSLNLDEICFTDHVDYGIKIDHDEKTNDFAIYNVDYPQYFKEIKTLQVKFPQIRIKKGLEFGIQKHTIPQYEKIYDKYPLDFIILSIHQIDNLGLYERDYQKNKTEDEYVLGYYQYLLDIIKSYKHYSVLGHLDLISRYDYKVINRYYPFEKIKPLVTEILKTVIKDNKGIEVNTSSFGYNLPDLIPQTEILKLYHELGGKIITIGSDAHDENRLYDHIDYVKEKLKELGFTEYCTFEELKPIFHNL